MKRYSQPEQTQGLMEWQAQPKKSEAQTKKEENKKSNKERQK